MWDVKQKSLKEENNVYILVKVSIFVLFLLFRALNTGMRNLNTNLKKKIYIIINQRLCKSSLSKDASTAPQTSDCYK